MTNMRIDANILYRVMKVVDGQLAKDDPSPAARSLDDVVNDPARRQYADMVALAYNATIAQLEKMIHGEAR